MTQEANGEVVEQASGDEFRSPVKKLTKFFRRSRLGWKRKARAAKQRCKLLGNQVRAVERSRASWRSKAEAAQGQLRQLQRELAALWQRSSNWEPPRGAWRRFSLIEKGATATRPTLSL